jgi:hypothetical protein
LLQENASGILLDPPAPLQLVADYQFNNNLIDDANGYNLTGIDITYNNDSAVFNGVTSEARRSDTNDIFSFTDGVNDLPFRIETSIKFNSFTNSFQFIVSKRDGNSINLEWALFQRNSDNTLGFALFSGEQNISSIIVRSQLSTGTNNIYNVVIDYDGSKTLDGFNMKVNGVLSNVKEEQGNYIGMSKTNSDLLLGRAGWTNASNLKLDGQIDYLKIYR